MSKHQLTCCLLDDLLPLIQRFPDLPVSNISYNRNFIELLSNLYLPDIPAASQLKPLRPEKTLRIGIRYQEQGNAKYDNTKLERLHRLLRQDYQAVCNKLERHFKSIEDDLARLKRDKHFSKLAKKLIRISPLVYTASGEALPGNHFDASAALDPDDLQIRYYDTFRVHLSAIFKRLSQRQGYGELQQFITHVNNRFIPKEIIPPTTRYTSTSRQIRDRVLTLEEIPPLYTPLRGALAADCSMLTVPYFGILKNTRAFWIIRGSNSAAKPDGYLFMVEITLQNGTTEPYIITINGPKLDQTDCNAVFHLLCDIYQTRSFLVADLHKANNLVNSPRIEKAITSLGGSNVRIELPPGWQALSVWQKNTIAYENFYRHDRLEHPKRVNSQKLALFNPQTAEPETSNFYPKQRIGELSLINRTIIAHYFLQSPVTGIDDTHLMQLLDLQVEHLKHSDAVIGLYQGGLVKVEDFSILKTHFGFTLDDFAKLPSSVRIQSLANLYHHFRNDPSISEQQWAHICRKTFNELKIIADNGFERGERELTLQQMASIPDEHIEHYWETVSPYLITERGVVDYFLLRVLVKHFHSYNSITRFLEFLDQHPDAAETVKPEDPRWFDYLQRLKAQAPQHPALPRLFQAIFHEHPLNSEISMSASEVVKRFQAARDLGKEVNYSLIENIFEQRGWQAILASTAAELELAKTGY